MRWPIYRHIPRKRVPISGFGPCRMVRAAVPAGVAGGRPIKQIEQIFGDKPKHLARVQTRSETARQVERRSVSCY